MLDGSMRAGQDVIDGRTLASVRGNTGVGDGILGFDDIAYALQAGCDPLAEDSSYRAAGRTRLAFGKQWLRNGQCLPGGKTRCWCVGRQRRLWLHARDRQANGQNSKRQGGNKDLQL